MWTPELIELAGRVRQSPSDIALVEVFWRRLLDANEFDDAQKWLDVLVAACRVSRPFRALRLLETQAAYTENDEVAARLRRELGVGYDAESIAFSEAELRLRTLHPEAARFFARFSDECDGAPVRWVRHALALPHLVVGDEPLVVVGDLSVAGALVDSSYPMALTVVLGSVRCRDAVMRGSTLVTGSLDVDGLWYLNSGNDYAVEVHGDARARVMVEGGMSTTVRGLLSGACLISLQNQVRSAAGVLPRSNELGADVAALLDSRALDDDCELIVEQVVTLATDEEPLCIA